MFDADPKAIQHIKFTGNPERVRETETLFILEEVKNLSWILSQRTMKVL